MISTGSGSKKKRTQRDDNLGFKLSVVAPAEKGEMTYEKPHNRELSLSRCSRLFGLSREDIY
ncbi:MAG: hypothetical protein MK086_14405, partial [Flavobacteriales bacterium]|nr:hypothetical protein [Flavobacteriales bacterium]